MAEEGKSPPMTIHVGNIALGIVVLHGLVPKNTKQAIENMDAMEILLDGPFELIDRLDEESAITVIGKPALTLLIGMAVLTAIRRKTGYKWGFWIGGFGVAL